MRNAPARDRATSVSPRNTPLTTHNPSHNPGVPWTEDEHRLFLLGLQKLGKVRARFSRGNTFFPQNPTSRRPAVCPRARVVPPRALWAWLSREARFDPQPPTPIRSADSAATSTPCGAKVAPSLMKRVGVEAVYGTESRTFESFRVRRESPFSGAFAFSGPESFSRRALAGNTARSAMSSVCGTGRGRLAAKGRGNERSSTCGGPSFARSRAC